MVTDERTNERKFNLRSTLSLAGLVLFLCFSTAAQSSQDTLNHVSRFSTFTFFKRDGTCLYGTIAKADAATITVNQVNQSSTILNRGDILQISQGDALLLSARSSWADVASTPVNSSEALVLSLKNGHKAKGKPLKVMPQSITLKHDFVATTYPKGEIATVVYLRVKPESNNFDYLLEEAPFLVFFTPEFYWRSAGLEGRIPVLLYDASKPENNTPLKCPHP